MITARNQLDGLAHSVRKSLTELGDKVPADEKSSIEAALKEADEALKTEDNSRIEAQGQALSVLAQKLAEHAQPAPGQAPGGEPAQAAKDDDNVVDAEFTEVKDKK